MKKHTLEGRLWDNHFLSLPKRRGGTSLHKARVINTTQFLLECEEGIPRNRLTFSYSEMVPQWWHQDKLGVPCFKIWVSKHSNPFNLRKCGWWNGNFLFLSIFLFLHTHTHTFGGWRSPMDTVLQNPSTLFFEIEPLTETWSLMF